MSSGAPFVSVVADSGLTFLVAGACILLALAAKIFPSATILKIVIAQLLIAVGRGG
jgi:hypothetical protein